MINFHLSLEPIYFETHSNIFSELVLLDERSPHWWIVLSHGVFKADELEIRWLKSFR
jgi:hypothetical protein